MLALIDAMFGIVGGDEGERLIVTLLHPFGCVVVGHNPVAHIVLQFRDGYRVALIVGVVLYDWEHMDTET